MTIKKHVDFDSLLSKTASTEVIIGALQVDDEKKEPLDKTASDIYETSNKKEKVDDATMLATGAASAAGVHQYMEAKKAKKKFKEEHAKSTGSKLKSYGKRIYDAVKIKGPKASKQLKKMKNATRNTKIGAGVAGAALVGNAVNDASGDKIASVMSGLSKKPYALSKTATESREQDFNEKAEYDKKSVPGNRSTRNGDTLITALGLNKTNDKPVADVMRQKLQEKTASAAFDKLQRETAKEVERESTPRGGAEARGKQGAATGALAGFMYGAKKKNPMGRKGKIAAGLWHGAAGAAWGGGGAAAATYAKKSLLPDGEYDKAKAYSRKMEKRASCEVMLKVASLDVMQNDGDIDMEYGMSAESYIEKVAKLDMLGNLVKKFKGSRSKPSLTDGFKGGGMNTGVNAPKLTGAARTKDDMLAAQRRKNIAKGNTFDFS